MIFCSAFYGLYMASVFKTFGSVTGDIDDGTLTLAGSLGSACNGLFRIVFATAADKYGFKIVFAIILCLQITVAGTIYFVVTFNSVLYAIYVCIGYACLGGNYAIFPPLSAKIFGAKNGGQIYSIAFFSFGITSITGFLISNYAIVKVGEETFFFIASGMSACSLILLAFFKEEPFTKESKE